MKKDPFYVPDGNGGWREYPDSELRADIAKIDLPPGLTVDSFIERMHEILDERRAPRELPADQMQGEAMSYTDRIALLVEVGEAAIRWRARRQDAIAVTSGKTFTALGKAEADLARLAGEYQARYPDRRDAANDEVVKR